MWMEEFHSTCIDFYEGCKNFRIRFLYIINKDGYNTIKKYFNNFSESMTILDNVERNIEGINDVVFRNETEETGNVNSSSVVSFSEENISDLADEARKKLFVPALNKFWEWRFKLKKILAEGYSGHNYSLEYDKYRVDIMTLFDFFSEIEKNLIRLLNVLGSML